ncbi:MAG: two-component regulator propeller domain-containing protein [Bacteroidota bacterium]
MKINYLISFIFVLFISFSLKSQCQWTIYNPTNSGLPDYYINNFFIDHNDNIWFTSSMGIAKFDGDTSWTLYNSNTTGGGLPNNYTNLIKEDSYGNIWVCHSLGISRYDGNNWNTYNTGNSPLFGNYIVSFAPDRYGNVWFSSMGTKGGGVTFYNNVSTWHTFNTINTPNLVSNEISSIAIDYTDNVWFASASNSEPGITCFSGMNWTTIASADTIPLYNIRSIFPDSKGNIWTTSNEFEGVLKFDGVNWSHFSSQNSGLPSDYINCISEDIYGNIWFGTYNGAAKYDENNSWTAYSTLNGLPDNVVKAIAADSKGYIYFITNYGVAKLNTLANLQVFVHNNGYYLDSQYIKLELFNHDVQSVFGQDSLFYVLDNSQQIYFSFDMILPGNYYIKAVKKDQSFLPAVLNSYYAYNDTSYLWEDATIVSINECSWNYTNMNMYTIDSNIISGNGIFSGNISFSNSKSNGEPVPGAEVYIEQEPNDSPSFYTQTDTSGNFILDNIPDGTGYKLIIDIPGLPLIETYDSISVTSSEFVFDKLNFIVDTSGIFIEPASAVIYKNDAFSISVYPNPFSSELIVDYYLNENNYVQIDLINEIGIKIKNLFSNNQISGNHTLRTNCFDKLDAGNYFLNVRIGNSNYYKKLILTK